MQHLTSVWFILGFTPIITTAAPIDSYATPTTSSNSNQCICLHNPVTDNVIRDCVQQQRKNETKPRFFCTDKDDVQQEQQGVKNWNVLPAHHVDCTPCENKAAVSDGIPRGD